MDKLSCILDKILIFKGLRFEKDFNAEFSLPRQKRNLGGFNDKLVNEFIVHPKYLERLVPFVTIVMPVENKPNTEVKVSFFIS